MTTRTLLHLVVPFTEPSTCQLPTGDPRTDLPWSERDHTIVGRVQVNVKKRADMLMGVISPCPGPLESVRRRSCRMSYGSFSPSCSRLTDRA